MAKHVDKVSDIFVPALSRADFSEQLQHGDILMMSGSEAISKVIEGETKSPWSHVGYVAILGHHDDADGLWYPTQPLFVEAVFKYGVRISCLTKTYLNCYDGDMVLCRRALPVSTQATIVNKAISRVGDGYDWQSEVEQAAHNILGFLPEHATNSELYCSGLVQYASTARSPELQKPNGNVMPAPEDIWTDPTVLPVCKMLKGQA